METKKIFPEGLIGRKIGMTQVFAENGDAIPVTVLELGPCTILDIRKSDSDGYSAVQFGFCPKKTHRVSKPEMGHFAKSGKGAFYFVKEVRCDVEKLGWTQLGMQISPVDVFEAGELVDVSGKSIGRGFSGVVKKFKVKGQPSTRGTHEVRRHIGSIGCRKTPARVFKNKKMPGHYGNENVTVQNLKVIAVRPEENVILVRGCIPGAKGTFISVKKAVKSYTGPVSRVPTNKESSQEAA